MSVHHGTTGGSADDATQTDAQRTQGARSWRVRHATPADALALAALRWEFRAGIAERLDEGRDAFVARCADWVRDRLERGRWLCWVVEAEGVVGGCLWLQPVEKIPNPTAERERHAYVSSVYVQPRLRGGAGTALVAEAMAWCAANGVDSAILWPQPRSRPLYERFGFTAPDLLEARVGQERRP